MERKNTFTKILAIISTTCAVMTLLINISNKISSVSTTKEPEAARVVYIEAVPETEYADADTEEIDTKADNDSEESGAYVFANTIDGKTVLVDKGDTLLW